MSFRQRAFLSAFGAALLPAAFTASAGAQGLTASAADPSSAATAATPITAATPAASPPAAAPAAAAGESWSLSSFDFSGYIDLYYSFNANRPSNAANGQTNDLYNFNDKTDQLNLEAAKLTINHDPAPLGVHIDVLFGRTNALIHSPAEQSTDNYIEQAFISIKPPGTHGTEFDLGQFTTSAGAEVIETPNNWNYSHSLLFSWAVPYYHFGLRTSTPVTKTWTAGVQLVNGWNNVVNNNGGVTVGLTSAVTTSKATWNLNYYTGPSNTDTQRGYRNLIDTTVLLTPTSRFNAYINYDYGQNHSTLAAPLSPLVSLHWQGIAVAARQQLAGGSAIAGRYEWFADQGFSTGTDQRLEEFTATYEYKWANGLMTRAELRRDNSDQPFFHKGNTEMVHAQTTATVGFLFVFPKR